MTKEELDYSEWPADKANNADRSDTHPQRDALLCTSSRKEVRQLDFHGVTTAEGKPPRATRNGLDQGAPPSSSCTLSEPYQSSLKRLPSFPTRPLKMDEQQEARRNAGKKEQKKTGRELQLFLFFSSFFFAQDEDFLSVCKTTRALP